MLDFLTKFMEDPGSPGLNFETRQGAKDSSMKSARITQDLRTILHQSDGMLTLLYAGLRAFKRRLCISDATLRAARRAGQNDTHETIPILPAFEALMLETPKADRSDWVFNPLSLQMKLGRSVRHQRPDADWVGKVISRIGKEAGITVEEGDERTGRPIKYASAHDLRRSCGERLRNTNVPPLIICRVMRHSSWETTRKHYAPGDVQQAAETLNQLLGENES